MRPVKQKNDIKRQPQEARSPAVVFLYIYFLGIKKNSISWGNCSYFHFHILYIFIT